MDRLTYAIAEYIESQPNAYARPGFDDGANWVEVSVNTRTDGWVWGTVDVLPDGTLRIGEWSGQSAIRALLTAGGFAA
jgi:hypothetical protein